MFNLFKKKRNSGEGEQYEDMADMKDMENAVIVEEVVIEEALRQAQGKEGGGADIPLPDYGDDYRASRWFRFGKFVMTALVFLLPLFFLPLTAAPVETVKMFFVYGCALLAFVSFLAISIHRRRFSYVRSPFNFAVFALLIVSAVSAWFSIARGVSIAGNYLDPNSLVAVLAYAILFFLTGYYFTGEDLPRLGKAFFSGTALASLLGILASFGTYIFPWSFARAAGFTTVGSLSGWGVLMAVALSALSVLPFGELSRAKKFLVSLAGAVFLMGLLVLNYQTIWAIVAFLMIMIAAARFVAEDRLGAPLAIGVVAVCLTILSPHLPRIGQTPSEVRPSFSASWAVATGAATKWRLAVGSGPATFGYDYALYRPAGINQTNFWGVRFDQGYDFLVTFFATYGILGILALALLVHAFLRNMVSGFYDRLRAPLTAGVSAGIIAWVFHPAFFAGSAYLFIGFGLIAAMTGSRREAIMRALRPTVAFASFLVLLVLAVLSLSSFYFLGKGFYAAYAYGKGIDALSANDGARASSYLASAVGWDRSDQYLRAWSQAIIADVRQSLAQGGQSPADLQAKIAQAVRAASDASLANPADAMNFSNEGNIYESLIPIAGGAEQAAYESYDKAMARDPVSPSGPFAAARARVTAAEQMQGLGNVERASRIGEARTFLEKALALKPDYAPAHFMLAQLYLKEGNVSRAVERVEAIKAANPFDAGVAFQLGMLYYDSGQTDFAEREFSRAVDINTDYSNARYFLGLIYDKQGKREAALAQFRRIAELNPENLEVTRIIANLEAGKRALENIAPPEAPPEKRANVPVPEEKK